MQNATNRKLRFTPTACVLTSLIVGAASVASEITFETRALTGTDGPLGPGLGAGVTFGASILSSTFSYPPRLNGAGQIVFRGRFFGSTGGIGSFFSEGGGASLVPVAVTGDPAPGTAADITFSRVEVPSLNDAGQIAARGILTGPGVDDTNDEGIWSEGGGSGLVLVAREGNQAPGTPAGVNFSSFESPLLNAAGQIAFIATLTGPGVDNTNDQGIWFEGGGPGLVLIAREGDQAPGTPVGVNFDGLNYLVLNAAGQIAFNGSLTGAGVDATTNRSGIWSGGGGVGLALIARDGDQAPGAGPGAIFSDFSDFLAGSVYPRLNDAGQIAFVATLAGSGVDDSNDEGIWATDTGGVLHMVLRTGDQAPGTDDGVSFSDFLSSEFRLNGAGRIAFSAALTGPGLDNTNDDGVWLGGGGSGLALVVRTGNQAPGTPIGVNFSSLGIRALNDAGQISVRGSLTGPGLSNADRSGIWATDPDGLLQLIFRSGDLFDVSNDPMIPDLRTIGTGPWTQGASLNEAGQLAFRLDFTDRSGGLFVASFADPSASTFNLTITPATAPANGYDFEWNSQPGKVYDLVTSTDLATPVTQWPVHASYGDIPATGTTTTLTAVPADGPQRFFAVVEK